MYQKKQCAYGNARLVDNENKVVIPVDLRKDMDIRRNDEIVFNKVDEDTIMLSVRRVRG